MEVDTVRTPIRVLLIDDDDGDYFLTKDLLEERRSARLRR